MIPIPFSLPDDIAEGLAAIPTAFDVKRHRFETPRSSWARFDG